MSKIFISYSRNKVELITELVDDLKILEHQVWFDQDLEGGQAWWDKIISEILKCEILIFVLCQDSLQSLACKRELNFAIDLGKNVIPIIFSDENVSYNLLPPELSKIQSVKYDCNDRKSALKLATICSKTKSAELLPDPMPKPPDIPLSYLGNIAEIIASPNNINFEKQSSLLIDIKKGLLDPNTFHDTTKLLKNFRKRRDLYAVIDKEIDELLTTKSKKTISLKVFQRNQKKQFISSNQTDRKKKTNATISSTINFYYAAIIACWHSLIYFISFQLRYVDSNGILVTFNSFRFFMLISGITIIFCFVKNINKKTIFLYSIFSIICSVIIEYFLVFANTLYRDFHIQFKWAINNFITCFSISFLTLLISNQIYSNRLILKNILSFSFYVAFGAFIFPIIIFYFTNHYDQIYFERILSGFVIDMSDSFNMQHTFYNSLSYFIFFVGVMIGYKKLVSISNEQIYSMLIYVMVGSTLGVIGYGLQLFPLFLKHFIYNYIFITVIIWGINNLGIFNKFQQIIE